MADTQRIDDPRRRVQRDPASIAFAQLAEELRRSHQFQESVDTCRAGLAIHPGYLSARVTLGRALIELNELEQAQAELQTVLKSARNTAPRSRWRGTIRICSRPSPTSRGRWSRRRRRPRPTVSRSIRCAT